MYNPMLDTFIAVSNYGSFTKAAEHLVYFTHCRYETDERA